MHLQRDLTRALDGRGSSSVLRMQLDHLRVTPILCIQRNHVAEGTCTARMLLTAFVPAWKMLRRVADGADVDGCVRTAMCVRAYPSGR